MIGASEFRELVSGRRRGAWAAGLRTLLQVAEIPFTAAVRWRNWRFDTGRLAAVRVGVPVISVGNLSMGGTGKTPMVEWLARWLRGRGLRVCLISRGYGAEDGARNDEALELERRLPDVPHVQNPDRVAAARMAIEEFESQVIVLDDAFQHRRIARDLDIVLVDALEPFGFGHVFPRGTLREPRRGLGRADVVALTRADLVDAGERARIRAEVGRHAPRAAWLELSHAARRLVSADGREQPIESLAGRKVAAFCGIGNPEGFRQTLARCGYRVEALREYADHYAYQRQDVEQLAEWAQHLGVDAVVCTCKDLVKLDVSRLGSKPLWAVSIELEMLAGQTDLETRMVRILGP